MHVFVAGLVPIAATLAVCSVTACEGNAPAPPPPPVVRQPQPGPLVQPPPGLVSRFANTDQIAPGAKLG